MSFLTLVLFSYGFTNIIVNGTIFESLRRWSFKNLPSPLDRFFMCPMCIGFWAGVLFSVMFQFIFTSGSPGLVAYNIISSGFIASGTTYLISGLYFFLISFSSGCSGCRGKSSNAQRTLEKGDR